MRGQLDYPFFLVLVVLIASGFLVVQVGGKLGFERDMGVAQASVLKVNNDVLLFDSFVNDAAKQVLQGVLEKERENPLLFFSSKDEGSKCALANDPSAPKAVVPLNLQARLAEKLNAGLRPYLESYDAQSTVRSAKTTFEVGIQDGGFSIIALEPVEFALIDKDGIQIGRAGHRPAFKLDFAHSLGKYVEANDMLVRVAQKCASDLPNPLKCAQDDASGWNPTALDGDKVMFILGSAENHPCYILFLPKQKEAQPARSQPSAEVPPAVGEVQG